MRYVYEIMTQVERLPDATKLVPEAALLNGETAKMFTGAIAERERKSAQEIDVLSHSQIVVGDRVITTLLVRRPAASADPLRN